MKHTIADFYLNDNQPSTKNWASFSTILNSSDEQFIIHPRYMPWLFPLKEKTSLFAPHTNNDEIKQLTSISKFRNNMWLSINRILNFYGYDITIENTIIKRNDFNKKLDNWYTPKNTYLTEITRILKSMQLFGFNEYATAFYYELSKIYTCENQRNIISPKLFNTWTTIIERT